MRPGDQEQDTPAGGLSFPRTATTKPLVSLSRTDVLLLALVLESYAQAPASPLTASARKRANELANVIAAELLK